MDDQSNSYDSQNRLIEANMGGVVQAMAYDPDGVRIHKIVGGESTDYLTDSNRDYAQVLYGRSATSELNYTFGTDLVGLSTGVENFTYHTDALGSTRLLTDDAGTVADDVRYDAWGEKLSGGDVLENQYLYTGEQFNGGLGKTYLRARYYDAGVGRFSQMDSSIGRQFFPLTQNKYIYGNADSTNSLDPSGNISFISQGIASAVRSAMTTTVQATVRVYSGARKGASVTLKKQVGCFIGVQYINRKRDRVEGHHPLQKSIVDGDGAQHLFETARKTHQMLHTVQNMIFREKGLPPLNTSADNYTKYFSRNPAMRRVAFTASLQAAKKVDKYCGYKGKKTFEKAVQREIKRFVKKNGPVP